MQNSWRCVRGAWRRAPTNGSPTQRSWLLPCRATERKSKSDSSAPNGSAPPPKSAGSGAAFRAHSQPPPSCWCSRVVSAWRSRHCGAPPRGTGARPKPSATRPTEPKTTRSRRSGPRRLPNARRIGCETLQKRRSNRCAPSARSWPRSSTGAPSKWRTSSVQTAMRPAHCSCWITPVPTSATGSGASSGTSPTVDSSSRSRPTNSECVLWRSAGTVLGSSPPATTKRQRCGTQRPGPRCSASKDTRALYVRLRSARTARGSSPEVGTTRRKCGTRRPGPNYSPSKDTRAP